MREPGIDIGRATAADLDGILVLQEKNQTARGGMLSASLARGKVAEMMLAMPLIVARCEGYIVGFLMSTTRALHAGLPIVQAMLSAYPGADDAYVYGPICVSAAARGKGVAQAMFAELRRLEPGREGILFIRSDNEASLRVHARMGMQEVATFQFNGADFIVFSYIG